MSYPRSTPISVRLVQCKQHIEDLERTLEQIAKTTSDPVAAKQARRALEGGEDDE